jgi:hypothetical protein
MQAIYRLLSSSVRARVPRVGQRINVKKTSLTEPNTLVYPQDLHVHTTFSKWDSAVVPQQTPELVARVRHARVLGISDHFEHLADQDYASYVDRIRALDMLVGTEVDGAGSVDFAASLTFDY